MKSGHKTCNKCKSVINIIQHDPLKMYCNACYGQVRLTIFYDGQKDFSKYFNIQKKHTTLYTYTEN